MHLYLIRHGESVVNTAGWRKNPAGGLTERGKQQATQLAAWMPGTVKKVNALYSSSMARAIETAGFLTEAYRLDLRVDHRIREWGGSYADGSPIADNDMPTRYATRQRGQYPFEKVAPDVDGGETYGDVYTRIGHFLTHICDKHTRDTVLVVSHGGVINVMVDQIFNVGPYRRCDIHIDYTAVTHFTYMTRGANREPWQLRLLNSTAHTA